MTFLQISHLYKRHFKKNISLNLENGTQKIFFVEHDFANIIVLYTYMMLYVAYYIREKCLATFVCARGIAAI